MQSSQRNQQNAVQRPEQKPAQSAEKKKKDPAAIEVRVTVIDEKAEKQPNTIGDLSNYAEGTRMIARLECPENVSQEDLCLLSDLVVSAFRYRFVCMYQLAEHVTEAQQNAEAGVMVASP